MFVLEVLVAVAVLAAAALLAAGRLDGLADETPDDPDVGVPVDRPLTSADIPRLRFRLAIRGYRMSDVDAAMAAVHHALQLAEAQPRGESSRMSQRSGLLSAEPERPPSPQPPAEPMPSPTPQPPFEPSPLPPPPPEPSPLPPPPLNSLTTWMPTERLAGVPPLTPHAPGLGKAL